MKAKSIQSDVFFKTSIQNIVSAYKKQHAGEYRLVCTAVEMQRKLLKDPEYASIEATGNRALYEISETLQQNLIIHLSDSALSWLKTKEGSRWFAKTFKEFALPSSI